MDYGRNFGGKESFLATSPKSSPRENSKKNNRKKYTTWEDSLPSKMVIIECQFTCHDKKHHIMGMTCMNSKNQHQAPLLP